MWSPISPLSDENQIPAVQTVHRKSVGRTPLKVLTGQPLTVLDQNRFLNKRSSLKKPSSHTVPISKETTRVSTGTPINVWVDTCHNDILAEISESDSWSSKNLQPCSLFMTKVPELNLKESLTCIKNNDQCRQPCDTLLLSNSVSSFENQQPSNGNEDIHSRDVEFNKLASLHPNFSANEFMEKPAATSMLEDDACEKATDLSHTLSQTSLDVCSDTTAGSPLKPYTDLDTTPLNEENLKLTVNDNVAVTVSSHSDLDFSKAKVFLPLTEKENRLDCMSLAEEYQVIGEVEPNVVSANDTNAIDPPSDQSSVTTLPDVLSEITCRIENCKISVEEDEEHFQHVSADDRDPVGSSFPVENLSSSLPESIMDDLKREQLINGLLVMLGTATAVTDDGAACVLPELSNLCFSVEDFDLLTEVLSGDQEISSYNLEECTAKNDSDILEAANKCFAPTEESTQDCSLTESDSTPLAGAEWHPPISNMSQTFQSNVASGPQKGTEDVSSTAYNCPTPVMPAQSSVHEIPLLSRNIFKKLTPKILTPPCESGTSMTPISTSDGITWTTPIMLLNKSMNTSWDFVGKGKSNAKDNSSETDSLLWNFSREALCNASREELMDRLEGTLTVVEVLSRQLHDWQQAKVSSSKPSEQRECSTQTCVTYCSAEEQYYHNLYLKTLSRLQSIQRCWEEEEQLYQILKEATETLVSHNTEAASLIEFAENLYEVTQKDRVNLNQNVRCIRALLVDNMTSLAEMSEKIKDNLLQRDEMRACMEDAIRAKEAADQCLKDLEIHSSAIIAELRRDLDSEKQLCEAVKEAYEQQLSYNEELVEFVHSARSVCSEMEDARTQLQRQCSQARELMSEHWRLFEVMKEKTQTALGEHDSIKNERDMAVLENEKMCSHLKNVKSQNEQLKLENSRLGSELESLMERLCNLESEVEQLKEENCELVEHLSAKDSSMKLLEKELNEATARGREYQDHIKYLSAEAVPSLERDLSKALKEKQALQAQQQVLKREHASQIACYIESLEFLEQENSVCREQVSETESQLKTHHLTLLERNFQCENLKDTIKELQREMKALQEKLSNTKDEAQKTITEMGKEISDSSTEVSKIRSHLLGLIENLRESTIRETKENLCGPHTPGGTLVLSKTFHEEHTNTTNLNATDCEDQKTKGIWSKTSAFTVVLPVASPPSAGTPQVNLAEILCELSNNIVSDVVTTSSFAIDMKQQIIKDLKKEISFLKEEMQNQRFQNTSDMRDLQDEADKLRRRNYILDEKMNHKDKCISQLQEVVTQQEHKILQQFSKAKESEALIEENGKLQLSLKLCENEVEVLKAELAQNPAEAARNWIQEKCLLHKDLTMLRLKLVDTDYSKSETVQRLLRHKDILTANLARSEAEVRTLDNIIEKIRGAFLSIPDDVNRSDELKRIMEILN